MDVMLFSGEERGIYMYGISSTLLEIDHRLRKAPKPIPNFEAKPLLARLVLPWGTRWESRVLISFFFALFLLPFMWVFAFGIGG